MAVLGPPDHSNWNELQFAAQHLGVRLKSLPVKAADEFAKAFEAGIKGHSKALIVLPSPITNYHQKEIVSLAAKHRLPAMYGVNRYVVHGGLMSYGPNIAALHHRAAYYVDKILKGTKPSDLPIQQPSKFKFLINLRTAKSLGVVVPPSVIARADEVVE